MDKPINELHNPPRWAGIMPAMLGVLETLTAPEASKQLIRDEILRLARYVDAMNERPEGEDKSTGVNL